MKNQKIKALAEALEAISSMVAKCDKALVSVKGKPAQETLLKRRIDALQLAVELIENEISALKIKKQP